MTTEIMMFFRLKAWGVVYGGVISSVTMASLDGSG